MSFESFAEFLDMGGHGLYVWMSYAIAAVLILINLVSPILRRKQLVSELVRRLRREKNAS